jgi:hypothetical protein
LGHDLFVSLLRRSRLSQGVTMNRNDQEELLQRIDKMKNNDYDNYDVEVDYKDKYSKDLEELSMELDDTINYLQKRRAI